MTTKLLRLPAVLDRCARTRSAHYRDVADGLFTPPVRLGSRCSAWPEHEVDALLRAQIAGASPRELRALVTRLIAERQMTTQSAA
jgi:prophage regulatory protein